MRAIIWTKYGPPEVLQLEELTKPVPKDNEVLVRVIATTVAAGDTEVRSLTLPFLYRLPLRLYAGFLAPKRIRVLGQELAGDVVEVGKGVRGFKVGDAVFGTSGFSFGSYAEYVALPADEGLAKKSASLSYEEAAALPLGGLEALHFLRKANIQPGQSVLIYGAGGSIGTFAVQLAKHYGAKVSAVDKREKFEMLRAIGAEQVMDYRDEDFRLSAKSYDVIFDVVGKASFTAAVRALKPKGVFLRSNAGISDMLRGALLSMSSAKRVVMGSADHSVDDLTYLAGLLAEGKIKALIDRSYALEEMVEAHHYAESGDKQGNVVIEISRE
jgi:NADPH:quinone reductase-like Zn-dependent oxidoreductase